MGIMMVTSLSSYAQNVKMAMRWQKRQEENDYAPDKENFVDKSFQNQVEEKDNSQDKRSNQMETDIEIKMTAGKKLSAEEMEYLKNHKPADYQKAKTIERERKAYEKALSSCKTKEEVEQLKAEHAEAAAKRVRTIWKSPGISAQKKRELLKMEHMKAAALDDAMHEFMDSKEYKFLPDKAKDGKDGKGVEEDSSDMAKSGLNITPLQDEEAKFAQIEREAAGYGYDVEKEVAELKALMENNALMEKAAENTADGKAAENTADGKAAENTADGKAAENTANSKAVENVANSKVSENAVNRKIAGKTAKDTTEAAEGEKGREKTYFVPEGPSDDAGEEGSITRAILDEEAKLAKEDEENAAGSLKAGDARGEGTSEISETPENRKIWMVQAAYLVNQPYMVEVETSKVDVRK